MIAPTFNSLLFIDQFNLIIMNNKVKIRPDDQDLVKIRENYEEDYWSKKYGVSTEEIKKSGNYLGLQDRIIKALFRKKAFEF
jgi:hypothetical protein